MIGPEGNRGEWATGRATRSVGGAAVTIGDLAAVAAVTGLLLSIAFENGYPLLYTDSIGYEGSASEIGDFVRTAFLHLFGGGGQIAWPGGARPKVYAAFLLVTNGASALWLSIAVQALISSWLIWLVVRWSRLRSAANWTLGIGVFLSALTSLPWVAGMLMPDAFTAPLVLSLFLLAVARAEQGSFTKIALVACAAFSFAAHPSHIALGLGLVALLFAIKIFWQIPASRIELTVPVVSLGIGWSTLVLSGFILLGVISPIGARTPQPFALARYIADGPVREYLAHNCAYEKWALCPYQGLLSDDPDDFIWNPNLPWSWEHGDLNLLSQIRNEQSALIWSTFKSYGFEMIRAAFRNGTKQFFRISPTVISFVPADKQRLLATMTDIPELTNGVAHSLQGREDAEMLFLPPVQILTDIVLLCGGILAVLATVPYLRTAATRGSAGRIWLFVIFVAAASAGNALICGGLNAVHGRYQARVIWLIPFATCLSIGAVCQGRKSIENSIPNAAPDNRKAPHGV